MTFRGVCRSFRTTWLKKKSAVQSSSVVKRLTQNYHWTYHFILFIVGCWKRKVMSASSLLSRVAMNGSLDDQNGSAYHHHLSRDFSNLSMLNFGDRNQCVSNSNFLHDTEHNIHNANILQENLYSNDQTANSSSTTTSGNNNYSSVNHLIVDPSSFDDQFSGGMRRSANMTETVAVPSSEHVAEIVGRQGKQRISNNNK